MFSLLQRQGTGGFPCTFLQLRGFITILDKEFIKTETGGIKITFMIKKPVLYLVFTLASLALKAQQPVIDTMVTDTSSVYLIELIDKTVLSGKISENTGTSLIFNDVTIGKVNIPFSQIAGITKLTGEQYVIITTNDNKKFTGLILTQDKQEIKLRTETLGELSILNEKIKELKLVEKNQIKEGRYYIPNPHPTRYFFGPTAIPLQKGEGYYQNSYVLANSVQYGISDNFSIGGGFVIPLVFFITPKFGFRAGEFLYLGGGVLAASTFSTNTNFGVGIGYGSITLGNTENNFTFSGGWGFVKEETYDQQSAIFGTEWNAAKKPMFSVSGMLRVSPKLSLLTENWVFSAKELVYNSYPDEYEYKHRYRSVLSMGVRLMGERNSFDIGVAVLSIDGSTLGLPYLDYVFKF